jgi:hypothetical protein
VAGREGLAKDRDLRVGHGFSVFVGHAAADYGGGLQTNSQIFELLPGSQRQNAAIALVAVFVDFEKSGALDEQAVTSGNDAFDVEGAVGAADRGVVSTFGLVFCNQLDQSFLDGLATGILCYDSFNYGAGRGFWGAGKSLRTGAEAEQKGDETCKSRLHWSDK